MGLFTVLTVVTLIVAILVGVLNYSPDDSSIYRSMIELSFSKSFNTGLFCVVNEVDGSTVTFGATSSETACTSQILIRDNTFYKKLVLGGSVGLGEAYTDGFWTYDDQKFDLGDILSEFTVGATNGQRTAVDYAFDFLTIEKWDQWYTRKFLVTKTQQEDKDSVQFHYDLGDEVFETFLDDTMFYTCAMFQDGEQSLHDAQLNKIDILSRKLNIGKDDRVLDMGCGWGYSPYHIHKNTGAAAMGLTMSKNQYEYAKKRFAAEVGDASKLDYKYIDYRDWEALKEFKFNKIISIGMTEHVGIRNIDALFNSSSMLLDNSKDNTIALHYFTQGEVAPHKIPFEYSQACNRQTWIFKYIFPGICLLDPDWVQSAAVKSGFTLLHEEYYGLHYAKTLKLWRDAWNKPETKKVVEGNPAYGSNLWKVYEYYFAISEAMFRTGHVTLVHQVFVKPKKGSKAKYADVDYILNNFKVPNQ